MIAVIQCAATKRAGAGHLVSRNGEPVVFVADRLELIALIEEPTVIRRILRHLGLPTDLPTARPARPPPLPLGRSKPWYDDDDMMAP